MSTENEGQELDQEVIKEAKSMGWVPQEQFRGKPDDWVDADEFVERGRKVMPILVANNRRLQAQLLTRDKELDTLKSQLDGATAAIEKLEKHYTEANKRSVENAKRQLREELKAAREENDVDAELDIQDKLRDLDAATKNAESKPVKKDTPQGPQTPPELKAWYEANSWFGTDKQKTKLVVRIAEDLREEGSELQGPDFMDECVRLYEEQYGELEEGEKKPVRKPAGKVEGVPARGRAASSGRRFADLPKEAKEACWGDAEDLVGEGRRYKTMKDWEDAYATIYFSEN